MFQQQQFHMSPNPNSPCYDCHDSCIYCQCCVHYEQLLNDLGIQPAEQEIVYEEPVAKSNLPKPEQIVLTTAFNNLLQNTVKSELLDNYVKPTVTAVVQEQMTTTVQPELTRQVQATVQPAVKAAVRQTIAEAADSTTEQILTTVKTIADKFNSPLSVFTV